MTDNPYRIEGPALISFSGGRTSGRMLYEIVNAHEGELPDNVIVAFANTGKEREETLVFQRECGKRWNVRVYVVEWRPTQIEAERIVVLAEEGKASVQIAEWAREHASDDGFAIVGDNSLSRHGEPFEALIALKQRLPNGDERWCTQYLKVRAMHALMRWLGYGEPGDYLEPIGLRHDEGLRILTGLARAEKDRRRVCYPLDKANVSKRDVNAFWWGTDRRYETSEKPRGFDLELPQLWGNCDLCFAMGVATRRERVRREPSVAVWWNAAEVRHGATFNKRESVADLIRDAKNHKATPDLLGDDDEDADCGTWCPGETA